MANPFPSFEELQELRENIRDIAHQYWLQHTFLTWEWFLLIALSIIPWIFWWKIVDKNRVQELLLYGFFIMICALVTDSIGSNMVWFSYPHKIYEVVPPLLPVDLTIVPVFMMAVYQYFPTWKSFIMANTTFAFFATYIGEPIFMWLDYYQLYGWKTYYSLLFYMITGIMGKWILVKTKGGST
jgi:hypothetical protein